MLVPLFSLVSIAGFIAWCFLFQRVWGILNQNTNQNKKIPLRGILKYYLSSSELSKKEKNYISYWVWGNFLLSLFVCFWLAYFFHSTDHSFLIVLLPIVWFYWLIRAMLWEKSDLVEQRKSKKKPTEK